MAFINPSYLGLKFGNMVFCFYLNEVRKREKMRILKQIGF